MSTAIMAQCWPLQMPPTPKAVLISLADNANDQGECWPSQPKIAERTCLGERTVRNAIKWLEEAGYLVADRSNGRHTRYMVVPTPAPRATPAGDATPASGSKTPAGDAGDPGSTCRSPRQEMPPNRKEPSITVSKATVSKRATEVACPDEVSEQTWNDWLKLRKTKRAPVTETVLRDAKTEAAKAGMSLEKFLVKWCSLGYQGLKADWLRPNERGQQAPPKQAMGKTAQAFLKLEARKHGKDPRMVRACDDDGHPALDGPGFGPDAGDGTD